MICNFMIFSESVGSGASLSAGKGSKSSVHEIYAPFVVSSKVYCVFIMEYSHASCQR